MQRPEKLASSHGREEAAEESDPHRTRELLRADSQSLKPGLSESSAQGAIDVSKLWSDSDGAAYTKVRDEIAAEWTVAGASRKEFLERAVELLAKSQSSPSKSHEDTLNWLDYVHSSGIDSKKYFDWVLEQHKLLAAEKRKFYDISLERFRECLFGADWLHANDESAIVNAHLLFADRYVMPQIYLGRFKDFHLALRLNGTCLSPPDADFATIESYGVTEVNIWILLGLRYWVSDDGKEKPPRSLFFIPLGNVFLTFQSEVNLDTAKFPLQYWRETGAVLALSILTTGTPGCLYMIQDSKYRQPLNIDDELPWEELSSGSESDRFTLAELRSEQSKTNLDHGLIRSYEHINFSESPAIELSVLSKSGLEIVQTGCKEESTEEFALLGLYPCKLPRS